MPKRVLEQATQEARAKQRRTLGPLRQLTVQPIRKTRYQQALNDFFEFLKNEKLVLPHSTLLLDRMVGDYLEHLWAAGFGRTVASNTLAGLQDAQPHLKGKLPESWRLLKAWVTHEVTNRAPPMPVDMLEAMVGYALFKGDHAFALTLLLGYYGLLRTGELLSLTGAHVTVKNPRGPAVVSLGLTKAGKRQGAAESITIHIEDVCRRLHQWCATRPDKTLIAGPSHIWRKKFADTLKALSFDKWDFRPYSLRRGGATNAFGQHGSFDKLLIAGRWQSQKTARIYVNSGMAVLAELKIPKTPFALTLRRQYLLSLSTSLPPLEPVSRCSQVRGRRKEHRKRDGNGVARNRLDLLLSRAWPDKGRKNLIYFGRRFFSGLAESLWGYIWKGCGKCSKGLVLSLISL